MFLSYANAIVKRASLNLVVPCSHSDAVVPGAARMKDKRRPKAGYAGSARTTNAWVYDATRSGVQK